MLKQIFAHTEIENDFAHLGPEFSTPLTPQPLNDPEWVHFNRALAQRLDLDVSAPDADQALLSLIAGQQPLPGGETIAAVYSGHQFGVWAGQLGDGRAHLLGRVSAPELSVEFQLKGSGRTPYSRMGDGRAVLRSSIREYLASHAMQALGVPTTEALGLVTSTDPVYREQVENAAIVLRTAPTFIRFGSFEHWQGKPDLMAKLLRYSIARFFPHLSPVQRWQDYEQVVLDVDLVKRWFSELVHSTARMVAHWQVLGFCHGVMNTDNMSILGLTIDYGPYAFMDEFQYAFTPNTTDRGGRYSWYQQPPVAFWNLSRLGSALTVLEIPKEELQAALEGFEPAFWAHYHELMRTKLGFSKLLPDEMSFYDRWWKLLQAGAADVTLSFRLLSRYPEDAQAFTALFAEQAQQELASWLAEYDERLARDGIDAQRRIAQMDAVNPLYVVRNHLAQRCILAAQQGDYEPLAEFFTVLNAPFTEQIDQAHWAQPPAEEERVPALSCSS